MALFDDEVPKKTDIPALTITSKDYQHSLRESGRNPANSILTHIGGTPLTGTYFRQYIGRDQQPMGFQPGAYDAYHSYTRIDRMIIKGDGKPSYQFNPEMGEMTKNFMAYLIFDLAPLIGDIFIKDIGDGRGGIYQINTAPEPKEIAATKVYYAELKLIGQATKEVWATLEDRTVDHLVYSADSVLRGGNAVITKETFDLSARLTQCAYFITQYMLAEFFWEAERTLCLRDDEYGWVYDSGYVRFCRDIIPSQFIPGGRPIEVHGYQTSRDFGNMKQLSIWDVFMNGNFDFLPLVNREHYYYDRNSFFSTRGYLGFSGTKFNYLIHAGKFDREAFPGTTSYAGAAWGYRPQPLAPIKMEYYFSDGFYDGNPEGEWEIFIYDFFVNRNIDRTKLLDFYKQFPSWEKRDQFYRSGLLIMMINVSRTITGEW